MPWKEATCMSEKLRFIEQIGLQERAFSELCREFGISRKTGYKLFNRYNQEGIAGLNARSRKPRRSINKTTDEIEEKILTARDLHPSWGGEKLLRYLKNKGYENLPTEKTIDRILKRNGLITAEESEKRKPWIRFEHENPNDLWQMDFKGHFAIGESRCYPLTVLDDHSRFSLSIKACENQTTNTVQQHLISVFREYGLPKRMTMDNGSPWGYSGTQEHTTLTAWLIRLGIKVSHSRPGHPQTQGKLERFHRTLKLELLKQYEFKNLIEAQEGFDWWREVYNKERPHGALGHAVPLDRYTKSNRCYPEELSSIEYDDQYIIRKVQYAGFIHFKGKVYKIGSAFHGQPVGLKENEEGLIDVYFCHQKVNKIDPRYSYEK
jgi:transposase InsO family protein